jgi:hypothetical protein
MTEQDGYRAGGGMCVCALLGAALAAECHVELYSMAVSAVVIENCIEHVQTEAVLEGNAA